jgi:hypothetical protein
MEIGSGKSESRSLRDENEETATTVVIVDPYVADPYVD